MDKEECYPDGKTCWFCPRLSGRSVSVFGFDSEKESRREVMRAMACVLRTPRHSPARVIRGGSNNGRGMAAMDGALGKGEMMARRHTTRRGRSRRRRRRRMRATKKKME